MADNFIASPGAGGDTFAADDVGGVKYPRSKVGFGSDGSYVDVDAANRLPVNNGQGVIEDAPHANGGTGVMAMAVRRSSDTGLVDADGDNAPLIVNDAGRLKCSMQVADTDMVTGTLTAANQTVVLDVRREGAATFMLTGTYTLLNLAFEFSIDSTNGANGTWYALSVVRSNAVIQEATSGNLNSNPAYTWNVGVSSYSFVRARVAGITSGAGIVGIKPGAMPVQVNPYVQFNNSSSLGAVASITAAISRLRQDANSIFAKNPPLAKTDRSIVATTTSAQAAGALATRSKLIIKNNDATNSIWINFGVAATVGAVAGNGSLEIAAKGFLELEGTNQALNVIAAAGTPAVTIWEF